MNPLNSITASERALLHNAGVWDRWRPEVYGLVRRDQPPTPRTDVPQFPDYTYVLCYDLLDTKTNQNVTRYYVPLKGRTGLVFDDLVAAIVACELAADA